MILILTRGNSPMRVPWRLPSTPAETGEVFARLDSISSDVHAARIMDVKSPVPNLGKYIKHAEVSGSDYEKLARLAERVSQMTQQEQWIFSGALDAESVNGLDDVLRIADHLGNYELIPEVSTDRELGGYLVEHDLLGVDFPQEVRPYLDYVAIGAEYYSSHGGAYTLHGYVRYKEDGQTLLQSKAAGMDMSQQMM